MHNQVTRRGFLKTGAILPAASLLSSTACATAAPPAQGSLKIGLVTWNLAADWTLDTVIKNCTEAKIEGVELRTTHAHGVEPELNDAQRREVRQRFADSPVKLVSLGSICEYHADDPAVVKQNIERTKEFVRLAKDLGIDGVKVRPNNCELVNGELHDPTLVQIGEALAQCGEYAKEYDIDIRVEVHGKNTQRGPAMKRIMDVANHSNVNVCWNSNPTDVEDGGFDANFDRLKDRIHFVHIRELIDETYPWQSLFSRLRAIGYNGYCCAEIPVASPDPVRYLKYYRALFLALQG